MAVRTKCKCRIVWMNRWPEFGLTHIIKGKCGEDFFWWTPFVVPANMEDELEELVWDYGI